MMKSIIYFIFLTIFIYADEHFAKLEPINTITIKSEVNGKVVLANSNLEGKVANGLIVKIDDKLDKFNIKSSSDSLKLIDKMIKLNTKLLPALKKSVENKKSLYQKIAPLSSSSLSQKDSIYSAYLNAKTQFDSTKEKILNLKNQKIKLIQNINTLKDRVKKKNITLNDKYLYELYVKKGEFVNIGMPIATIADISKAKLTIYLNEDELKNIDKKSIYINGKKSNLKFNKIWKIADKKYISSYKAQIILKPFTTFSKLIKVDIK